ncbi:hypothetical protein [Lentilactobacillus parabuchneri]|jgi:hypothetical protein|uniref:Uncharacterized protein n=3 Tax=Lentilactobacillus parabuchneri TaxID=152331 RepID=A0A0R1Z330_9LACO|nr:hypothetical protein [Lentilactobacillus parabuchneri]KRM47380.1 hypothetical protein FC51_GL001082 [Lentilactobacillus parabuchneri DSM 5707 = NBRC 107865]MBW0263836.1 hypothetical protein [Lentilactobacillus parabuchneri]MDG9736516.1 hypothetical protein [Lentilactobacillus parabuchneri]OBU97208.1 hypothetical protein A7B51_06220 [Lentilactobacillus parabuchneri]OCB79685.1 hypothetical protein A8O18_07695 [Lentilactobacillus parabuchneri]
MKKNSKRGLRLVAGISTVILMSPLFANSSVQVMLGNELNAHADVNAKKPDGDKSVHKAFTPKRKSQQAITSSIKYSHKVPVLKVALKPTSANYFKKGDQIHFKFSSKNVNLKNLRASYQKSLPFSYKKVSDHELVLTFKKSLNSGLYGQAYAIPTKNKKMTTEVKGTFDNHKLVIDNDQIHSFKLAARAHKASSSNATTQQNTASQQNTNNTATQQATTGQSHTGTTNTQQAATSPTANNNNATTNQQSSIKSQEAQRSDSTATTSQQSYANRSANNSNNQSYVSTQGKAVAKSSTGGTTSTEVNRPQASKVVQSASTTQAAAPSQSTTTDSTSSSEQAQTAQSTSTSSNQTTQASAATTTSSADTQAAANENSTVTTNSDGSISQSQQQNVNASDAYNTVLSRTKIQQGSTTKGYVSTPVPAASDPQATYNKYANEQSTSTTTTGQSSETATTSGATSTTTSSNDQSSQASTTPTTAQANSTGTVSSAAESQSTATTTDQNATTSSATDNANSTGQTSEGEAIFNAVKKNVSNQTSTWATVNEQGEIIKSYPWILKDIASKMAANQDTKGQVWKYAVPLTSGKTALVTIDGRSSTAKADEKTLLASMPALLKSLGNSSKTGMFDEAVDVDILKQSQYYKDLQTEQNNLQNASAKDAYNAVVGSTTFTNDNGTLNTSKYTTAPTPTASDPKATYTKLAAEQSNGSDTQSSTANTEDSDGTAIFDNIKSQVASQTGSWADATEQGEIVKDYPWILNDIAKKMAVAGANDSQVWNYKIPLTTGKTALVTINGQPDATNPSSLTATMPQLLKSLGSSATPDMFDDAVDSDILQNSDYYKDLQETSKQQKEASENTASSNGGSSMFSLANIFNIGGNPVTNIVNVFNPLSIIPGLIGAFVAVSTIGALTTIPIVGSVISSAVSAVSNIVKVTKSIVNVAFKAAPFIAPLIIIPALINVGLIMINAPLIIGGLLIAKPVIDAAVTIGTVVTIGSVVGTIGTIGTLGTIGGAIAIGTTMTMIGTAVAAGAIAAAVLPVIFKTISNIANAVAAISNLGTFITGFIIGSINAIATTMTVLGHLALAAPLLGVVSSIINPINAILSVVSALAFSVLTGNLLNLGTGLANVPLLAGFAIGASLVTLILTMLGRQLFSSATSAINKFIQGAKNVIQALALGAIIPAFIIAPTLIKIAMAFLALIPLAGWALKKFFDNIKAGLNTLKQFTNVIFIAVPLTAIATTVATTVTKAINKTGSLVSTTLGPLFVRLVVGALTLATLPLTIALGGLPFVVINIANRLFRDLVTGTAKLVAKVSSLAANVVTNIESQIQQVIKTVVSPVVGGAALLNGLLFIIPAITGIKILTSPILAILSLPLTILTNILVPSIANLLLPAIAVIGTGLALPVITGLLGLPIAMLLGTGLNNIVSSIINFPLLLLGNSLLSWLPAFLAGSVATISSLLKNGLPVVFNALISFGLPLILLPIGLVGSVISGLLLPFGLKWLALAPVILPAIFAVGLQLKWVFDAIKAVLGTIISTIKSVINTHLLLVGLTIIPTILSSIFNTLFGFGPLSVVGDLIKTMNKMFVNNFMLPQFVAFIVKLIAGGITNIVKSISNGFFNVIPNLLKRLFHFKGVTGLLGLLLGIPAMIFQGILNNVVPDVIGTLAGLLVLGFNLLVSTPLMFLGGIGSAIGRLILLLILNPIVQIANDLISWLPALAIGTLMNIINLVNGVITQGPIGLFLFGVPLLLNAGLLLANLLAIPTFLIKLAGNFFGLTNLMSLIFPLIAALLLGAGLKLMSFITTILNAIALVGQLILSGLTLPLWLGIPALNLVRKLALFSTILLALPHELLSLLGKLNSGLLKALWSGLTSLPSNLLKALLSFGKNVISTLIKDTLFALGAGLFGLLVLGGLSLAGNVIKTLLQLAKFFLVTLPLTIGGLILSTLGLLALNGLLGLGMILLSNTLLNGLVSIITKGLSALPGLVSQFITNTVKAFSLAAVLALNLFVGLFKIGNRLVMDFILGFLNLLNFAVKAVAGLPTLLGALATIVTAILPVPGHLLLAGLLFALTAGSLLAKLIVLPLDLLTNALNIVKIAQLLLTIPTIIAKFIGAIILSQLAGSVAKLLLTPLVWLNQAIAGALGFGLKALNGVVKLILPLIIGAIGLTVSIAIPVTLLGIRVLSGLLKNNPLLAVILLALPGLIPGLNLILGIALIVSVFGLAKNGLKLLLSPITAVLNFLKNAVISLLAFGALAFIGGVASLLFGLPLLGLINLGVKGLLNFAKLPFKIFNGFVANLIPALIGGAITGLIRLLTNGGVFGALKLLGIIPTILLGLLTALIPVVNGITVPLALLAALVELPLTLVEGLVNNVNSGLIGLFAGQFVKGILNFIGGIINAVAPILGGLLAVMLPTLLIGLTANIIWIWFLGPIFLNLAVDPMTDFVGFIIMVYTMFVQPALYIVFGLITVPLTLFFFVGMFANWLNPLRFIFQSISDFGTWSLILLGLGSFVAIELLKLSLVGLHLIPGVGLLSWLALTAGEIGLIALIAQFVINIIPSIIVAGIIVLGVVAIGAIVIVLQEVLNIGINVPSYLSYWILLPMAAILTVAGILMSLTLMLAADAIAVITQLPFIVGNLSFGLLTAFLANPIAGILANVVFGVIGLASIPAFFAGAFMVAQSWLAAVFPFDLFLYYVVMQNPIWEMANWIGLFPILGWIVALIVDVLWMIVGTWLPGILAIVNYSIFILTAVPLTFSAIIGVSLLLATGINGLLLLPVLLIGAAVVLGLIGLPIVIRYGLQMLPDLLFGVGVNIVFNWFLGPLLLKLAVDPIADFVGFIIMLYTMFTQPVLFYGFRIFLIPATILFFNGMFINWLNPLKDIFNGISSFAKLALPVLAVLGILAIDGLRLSAGLISIIPGVGLISAFTLGLAKWALIGLIAAYVINTIPSILAGAAIVFLVVGIGAIVIILQEVLNIGINVPSYLSYWVLLPMAVILTVTAILITLPLMLRDDFNITLLALPFIVNNLGLGLLTAFVANPLAAAIAAFSFGILGAASIPAFLAGSFMIAQTWLSSVFPLELFVYYLIMQNPIWEMANWIGLFPIIGWIVALIVDVLWMVVGTWVPGMFALLNYAIFISTAVPTTFSAIIGVSLMLSLGLVGLLALPINLIGGAILLGLLAIPSIIKTIAGLIGSLIYGIAANIIFVWFLGPIALDLAVNPIADFIGYVIELYTMFEQPLLYWVFGAISIPVTGLFFAGMFLNWLNPLRILFQGLTSFAKFALPTILLLSFAAVVGLQISDLFISLVPGMGLLANLGLFNGVVGLIGLITQYVINVIPSILALGAIVFLLVGIGAIVIILQEVLNIGINVPSFLSYWVLLPMAAVLGVLSVILILPSMLVSDLFATLIGLPFIVGNLGLGLLESFLANPLAAFLAALNFGILGVAAIPAFFIGTFMIAQSWLSSVFPFAEFVYYVVMNNPIWAMANWIGLVPIIGWIVALIVDVLWLVMGVWVPGMMSFLNYSIWALTTIPMVFSMITGVSLLLSLGLLGILAAPILLIGGAILLGLLAIPSIIKSVGKAIFGLVYGIASLIIFTWFLGPIALDLMVNPVADAIGFIIAIYTMFTQPVLYIAFAGLTVPTTFLFFAGAFMNWLNPLRYLYQGITFFAKFALPILALLGLGAIDGLRLSMLTLNLFPGVGLIGFIALTLAKLGLIGLIAQFVINAIPSVLALAFIVFIVVGIGAIVIILQEVLNLGINVPSFLSYWVLLPMAAMLGVGIVLISLPSMLVGDLLATLIGLPFIVGNLGLGLISGLLVNPLAAILAAFNFGVIGVASLPVFLAGTFMIAQSWLKSVFPIELAIYYIIMENPIWAMANWIGLIPIIGWIVALIVDVIWMIVGTWVPGMFALLNYAIFIMTQVPLTFSTVIGAAEFLSLGLAGLLGLPILLIGGAVLLGLLALPAIVLGIARLVLGTIYGIAVNIIWTWFLGPIGLTLAVNPIADFEGFIIMVYTMFVQPILYWGLGGIFIPATLFFFQGSFTNWLNPLGNLFQNITNYAYLALPLLAVLGLGTMDLFRLNVNVISLIPGVGLLAGLALFNAKWLLIGLIGLYVLNAIPSVLALAFIAFIVVGIGAIVIILQEVLNLGINVPSFLSYWVLLPMAAFLGVGITLITLPLMLIGDLVATLIALPGIVGSLRFALIAGFIANPLAAVLAAVIFAVLGVASIPAFLAGTFMIAQSWLGSVFPIELFIYYLIMENPIWGMANWIGLIPIIGWIVALIVDILWMIVGTWVPGMFAVLNYAIFIMTAVPLTFSTVIGLSMLLSLGLPGLILIPLGILINLLPIGLVALPIALPALLISGVINPLLGLIKNVAGFLTGAVTTLFEKLFGNNLLNSLLRTILNIIVILPKGLIGGLLTLPAWLMQQALKLNDFINKALAGLWSLVSNVITGLLFSIPETIFSSLGRLIISPITTIFNLIGFGILGLLNLLNPLTSLILPLIGAGLVGLMLTVGQIAKFMGNIVKAALSLMNLIIPALNVLRRIGVVQQAFALLQNTFGFLNDLNPLKLLGDLIKNVVLPLIIFATLAGVAQTIVRLLGMPLIGLMIPVIATMIGSIISLLLSPLALLGLPLIAGVAMLIPLIMAHMKSLAQVIPDLINLIGQLLINGTLDLAKLLLLPLALFTWPLIGLVNVLKSVLNGQHPLLNVFEKMGNVLKDLLGPLSAFVLDGLKTLAEGLSAGMSLFKMFGSLLLPIFPLNWLLALNQVPKLFASLINSFKGLGNIAGDIMNDFGRLALGIAAGLLGGLLMPLVLIGLLTKGLTDLAHNLFKTGLSGLFQGLKDLFNNGIKSLFAVIPNLFKAFLNGLGGFVKLAVLGLPDIVNPLGGLFKGAMLLGGLIPAGLALLGLPYSLFIKPVLDLVINNLVPIAVFFGLGLLNTLLNPLTLIVGFVKSVIDTIKAQNKLNGILKNIVNAVNTVFKGLQTIWGIGLALGSFVFHLISGAVTIITHLITSLFGKLLLNIAGLLFIINGSNPLKAIGSFVSNIKKMWNAGQVVPKVLKGIVQGLMKIGSTFTFFIRGIKHLGDLLTGFAIVPGALGVLGFLRQVNQQVVVGPFNWLMNQLVLPLIASGLTGLGLTLISPLFFLPTLLLSLPGNRLGRLILAVPLALLGNSFVQWLPAIILSGLGNLLNGGRSFLQNLFKTVALSGLATLITRGLTKGLGKLLTFGLILPLMLFGIKPLQFVKLLVKNGLFFKVFDTVVPLIIGGLLQAIMTVNGIKKFVGNAIKGIQNTLTNLMMFAVTAPIWFVTNGLNQLGQQIFKMFGNVANFFIKLITFPIQVLSFKGVPELIGNVIAGLGKVITYPLAIFNAVILGLPGFLLGRLLTHVVDLVSFLKVIPGIISGIGSVLFAPITTLFNVGKNIVSGLLNLIFKGVLDNLNTSLIGVVNAIESAISTVADSLKSGLSQLIKNLMNITLFGAEMVGLSLLSRLIPTIKVPAWLDNLLKTVGQIAQTILVLNTGLLIGYSLMKNATQSFMKGFVLPLIGFGVLPLIGAGLIANGIKQLGNTLKNFLSPLIGGLLGSLLGNLLNGNKNHNINININFNGLPLLLALIPLMSTLAVIGNGANSLIKSLASILPGLIQTLVGRNKTVILPIIIPIIVPLILPILLVPVLLAALLPLLLPIVLTVLLPVILPIIISTLVVLPLVVLGLPVLVAMVPLLPVVISIPVVLPALLPIILPIVGLGAQNGFGSSLFGGTTNNGFINLPTLGGSSVSADGTSSLPSLPNASNNSNNGGTSQVPSTGNHVGGNSQFPATPSTNHGKSNKVSENTNNENGNRNRNAETNSSQMNGLSGMTTPKSALVPDSVTGKDGLKAQQKLPQTNENIGNQVLIAVLGLLLMLLDVLGYVWISHRRKFSVD